LTKDAKKYKNEKNDKRQIKRRKVYRKNIERRKENVIRFKEFFYTKENITEEDKLRWNDAISEYSFELLLMYYSVGDDIEMMRPIFSETLKYKAMIWNVQYKLYTDSQYFELITLISLAVLFEISNEEALVLMKMRSVVPMHDLVLDFMLKTLITKEQFEKYSKNFEENSWENNNGYEGNVIGGTEPYCYLQPLLESQDKKEQQKYMKKYLKDWYRLCKEMSWYNLHKIDMTYYYGYWSFESVALTKILGLDAIGKDHQSKEFVAITDILGEPEISVDEESDRVDFTWRDYGVNVVIGYEEGIVENFFFYPLEIGRYSSCKQVCIFEEFDADLTLEEVRKKYGQPNREREDFLGYKLYYYLENYDMYFTFYDENHIYSILIGINY